MLKLTSRLTADTPISGTYLIQYHYGTLALCNRLYNCFIITVVVLLKIPWVFVEYKLEKCVFFFLASTTKAVICRVIGYKLPVPTMSFKRAFSRVNVAIKPSPKLFTVQTNSIAATAITPQHSTIRHHSSQFSDESQSFSKFAEK